MSENDLNIEIRGSNDCCITDNLRVTLGNFNVFAGENNAGKTTLVNKIIEHPAIKDNYDIIHIPASEVNPESSTLKSSLKTAPFYKSIQYILKPIFDTAIIDGLVKEFDKSPEKKAFISEVNRIISGYGVENKRFDIKIPYEKFESDTIIKIAKAIMHDDFDTEVDIVDIGQVGMGTQRLLAIALLQYYSQQNRKGSEPVAILVEEPEIYLHPKYKETFYSTLKQLSENGNLVIIDTHDSFFIELCANHYIYEVFRDPNKKHTTSVRPIDPGKEILPYSSGSLINYLVFGIPSKTLYIELYEYLKSLKFPDDTHYANLDEYISTELDIPKDQPKDPGYGPGLITLVTRLRHDMAHPSGEKTARFNSNCEAKTDNLITLIKKNK